MEALMLGKKQESLLRNKSSFIQIKKEELLLKQ